MTLLQKFLKTKQVSFSNCDAFKAAGKGRNLLVHALLGEAFTARWSAKILHVTGIPARLRRLAEQQ